MISNPKKGRATLHHAWVHLHLVETVTDNDKFRHAVQDAKYLIETINCGTLLMTKASRDWHAARCKRCQQILTAAILDGMRLDAKIENEEFDRIYKKAIEEGINNADTADTADTANETNLDNPSQVEP